MMHPLDFNISLRIQSGNKTKYSIKGGQMDMWLSLYWGSPIGTGIFLVCLGGMIYLLRRADEIKKRMQEEEKKKE